MGDEPRTPRTVFSGASVGGNLDMCTGTEFPFSDGCTWTSAQHVSGKIADGTLEFAYGEAPKSGQGRSCASACTARGVVRVDRIGDASKAADRKHASN